MTKLEEVGYLNVTKEFVNRKPVTLLSLTKKGRMAFQKYRENIYQAMGPLN
jgi:DNA-binding PadR family transcriptional regulator